MRLLNRADGCDGHYCVARLFRGAHGDFHEFWNEERHGRPAGWASAGTLYTTKRAAAAKLYQLCGMVNPARRRARASR